MRLGEWDSGGYRLRYFPSVDLAKRMSLEALPARIKETQMTALREI